MKDRCIIEAPVVFTQAPEDLNSALHTSSYAPSQFRLSSPPKAPQDISDKHNP